MKKRTGYPNLISLIQHILIIPSALLVMFIYCLKLFIVFLLLLSQVTELPEIVKDLADGRRTWEDVLNNYPLFEQQETTK